MRHQIKGKKLNRTASHRKATFRSLAIALIKNERIVTTSVKAKELRRIIEPIITRAKEDTMHNRREVFSFLHDNDSTSKLFNEVAPKCVDRPGGYTRVIKLGTRKGDGSEVSVIELVDYNDVKPDSASRKKKRTRRGSAKTKSDAPQAAAPAAPVAVADAPEAEVVEEVVAATEVETTETIAEVAEEVTTTEVVAEEAAEVVEETPEPVAEVTEEVVAAEEATEVVEESIEEVADSSEEATDDSDEEKKDA